MGQSYSKTTNVAAEHHAEHEHIDIRKSRMSTSAREIFAWDSVQVANYLYNKLRSSTCFNYGPATSDKPCNQNIAGSELLNITSKQLMRERWRYQPPNLSDLDLDNLSDQDLDQLHSEIRKLHQLIFDLFNHLQFNDSQCARFKSNTLPHDMATNKSSAIAVYKYLYADYKTLWSKLSTVGCNIRVYREVRNINEGIDGITEPSLNNLMHDLLLRDNPMSDQLRGKDFLQTFKNNAVFGNTLKQIENHSDTTNIFYFFHNIFNGMCGLSQEELEYLTSRFQCFIIAGEIYDCRDPHIIQPAATKINTAVRGKLTRKHTMRRYYALHTLQSALRTNPFAPTSDTITAAQETKPNIYTIRSEIRRALVSAYSAITHSYSNTVIPQEKLSLR
jgi:hypothetical protein